MIDKRNSLTSKKKKEIHWQQYFLYEKHELSILTEKKIKGKIEESKKSLRGSFIDSQILIKELLTEFGESSNFHRQFNDQFPNFQARSILGMQLYMILLTSKENWGYRKLNPNDHKHEHSLYWLINSRFNNDEISKYISENKEEKNLDLSKMKKLTTYQQMLLQGYEPIDDF